MASLLCNARECPGGGEAQGRAPGRLDLRQGKSGPWAELTLPHLGASLPHRGHWDLGLAALRTDGKGGWGITFCPSCGKGSLFGVCPCSIPNQGTMWGPRGEREQGTEAQCPDTPTLSDAAHAAPRHPAHRHAGADAARDTDAQSQVQELEEAALLQAAG